MSELERICAELRASLQQSTSGRHELLECARRLDSVALRVRQVARGTAVPAAEGIAGQLESAAKGCRDAAGRLEQAQRYGQSWIDRTCGSGGSTPASVHNRRPLTTAESKKLGGLAAQADASAADVIKARGGGASQVQQLRSGYGQMTLRDLAHLAVQGDREAVRAIKMAKQAGSQGKGGK